MAGYEPVYRAGGNPGGAATQPGADAGAFGAAVGGAIADLGDALTRRKLVDQQRDREIEATDASVELARATGDIEAEMRVLRENAQPGAAGHGAAAKEAIRARLKQVEEKYQDPRVQRWVKGRAAEIEARIADDEGAYEAASRVNKQVSDVGESVRLAANGVATEPGDGTKLIETLKTFRGGLAQSIRNEDLHRKLERDGTREIAAAWANAYLDKDPEHFGAVLQSGLLNDMLNPEDIDHLRSGVRVEVRRREVEAHAVYAQQKAAAIDKINLFEKRLTTGHEEPTENEFREIEELAKKFELKGDIYDVAMGREKQLWRRGTRGWSPAQYDGAIAELRAKGDKRSPVENRQLAFLEERVSTVRSEFHEQPELVASNRGDPPPAFDLANPQTWGTRVAWAERQAKQMGIEPPYLLREEKPVVERMLKGAPGEQLKALGMLGTFGAPAASKIIGELAPDGQGEMLKLAAALHPDTQRALLTGRDSLKLFDANKDLYDAASAEEIFREHAGAIPFGLRETVRQAARQIYAAAADEGNLGKWHEGVYRNSLMRAVGSVGLGGNRSGGFHKWNGQIILLPRGMKPDDFDKRLSRATDRELVDAMGGIAPQWRNGAHVTAAQLRALQLIPTPVVGQYKFGGAQGVLKNGAGQDVVLDIRRIPAK